MSTLVAVYGTLKRGLINYPLLQDAGLVGTDTLDCITLYDLGPYPGARLEPSGGILVEVFRVSNAELAQLDVLEDYSPEAPHLGLYDRQQVQTCYGLAWVYLYNHSVQGIEAMRQGSWQPAD